MAHLLFVTGTPMHVAGGSGTFVGIHVLQQALEAAGHTVTRLAPAPGRQPLGMTAARLWFNWQVRDAARRFEPDVLVGFDLDGVFMTGARCHVAAIKGILAEEMQFERGMVRATLGLQARFERRHVRRADRVLTTSVYAADRIATHYDVPRARVQVVPELIDLSRWRAALQAAPVEPPGRAGRILCVAHLYPRKDVATLLRALARLHAQGVPFRARIVGIGPERPRLIRQTRALGLEGCVDLPGHLPFAALTAAYRNADIFCLPSRQEGFGIVYLEAMAAGLPIVAARAAAVPEVAPDGECARLIPPGDEAVLAEVLAELLADPRARARLGEAGRTRVWRYDAPIVAAQFARAVGV